MRYQIHVTICAFFMTAACAGLVFSQGEKDAGKEFNQGFYQELQISENDLMQFGDSLKPLFEDMQKNVQAKAMSEVMKRAQDTSSPMTSEEGMKIGLGVAMDEMVGMQKPINDKAGDFFSEEKRQKMHLRLFQLKEGVMGHLASTDDQETIQGAFGFDMMQLMAGQPDFLELTPEQKDLVTKQQKETSLQTLALTSQATMKRMTENPGSLAEMQRLTKEFGEAETDEEREVIAKQLQKFNADMMKDVAPQLKKALLEGHENFMRVLTDAQKAKIKAVMADSPDYMKKLLAELDKGGKLNGLESWVPGMGAPGMASPKREAPRQRTRGERTFPGE